MKHLIENWRKHLNEEGFKCPTAEFVSVILPPAKREVVVIETSEGPVAFYRSSGSGTGMESEDMWLPFGGIAQNKGNPWMVKMPSSHPQAKNGKFPKENSEFYNIGSSLEKCYAENPFKKRDWMEYLTKFNLPHYDEVSEYAGVNRIEYGAMILNRWLGSKGALKIDWADGRGFYGAEKEDTKIADAPTLKDILRAVEQGKENK